MLEFVAVTIIGAVIVLFGCWIASIRDIAEGARSRSADCSLKLDDCKSELEQLRWQQEANQKHMEYLNAIFIEHLGETDEGGDA